MPAQTHVIQYDGGEHVEEIGGYHDLGTFANPLRRLNGRDRWALTLYAFSPDKTYDDMQADRGDAMEYLQAAGTADAMTVEICKPGGELWSALWGARWVRFVVGHQHEGDAALDVLIQLSGSTEMVSESEVFTADEAAELFESYYTTGDIPSEYRLRPVDGYAEDGTHVSPPAETDPHDISRKVYHGDIPGDIYYGRWPNRLTIYATIGSEGFTLSGRDSVGWPDNDHHWTARVAPEQLQQVLAVLGATPETDAADVLDLVAARFDDGTIPPKDPLEWLRDADIEFHITQQFLEN